VSAGSRSPQQVLDELGHRLEAAYAAAPARRARRRWGRSRILTVLGAVGVVGASTAAATRMVFAPAPPLPRLSRLAVDLGGGTSAGVRWQLTAARCSSPRGSFSLLLNTVSGGAGSACVALPGPPTTWFMSGASLVFGAAPAAATRVEVTFGAQHRDVSVLAVDAAALIAGRLPKFRVFVAALPSDGIATAMTAFDADGHLLIACDQRRCARP